MSVYQSEEEQIDAIKKWWNHYGNMVLTVIIIALFAVVAHQWWQQRQTNIAQAASSTYEQAVSSIAIKDEASARVAAESVIKQFPATVYALMSHLLLARMDVQKQNYTEANAHLTEVIEHGKVASLQQIARIRSAKILLAENKPDAALKLLDVVNDPGFASLIDEVRGDTLLAKNELLKARNAYEKALLEAPKDAPTRVLIEMKIADLPPGEKS